MELLYDADARLVALRKVDSSVDHGYQVRAPVRGHATWVISGAAFVSYYEIDASTSVRSTAHIDGDLLVVNLKLGPGSIPKAERNRILEVSVWFVERSPRSGRRREEPAASSFYEISDNFGRQGNHPRQ